MINIQASLLLHFHSARNSNFIPFFERHTTCLQELPSGRISRRPRRQHFRPRQDPRPSPAQPRFSHPRPASSASVAANSTTPIAFELTMNTFSLTLLCILFFVLCLPYQVSRLRFLAADLVLTMHGQPHELRPCGYDTNAVKVIITAILITTI